MRRPAPFRGMGLEACAACLTASRPGGVTGIDIINPVSAPARQRRIRPDFRAGLGLRPLVEDGRRGRRPTISGLRSLWMDRDIARPDGLHESGQTRLDFAYPYSGLRLVSRYPCRARLQFPRTNNSVEKPGLQDPTRDGKPRSGKAVPTLRIQLNATVRAGVLAQRRFLI